MRLIIALALFSSSAPAQPKARPPEVDPVPSEEIARFVNLVAGEARPPDFERRLRDQLERLARLEPARAPRHPLAPFASSIEAHVDRLAREFTAVAAELNGNDLGEDRRRAARARGLTILARLHLATGANAGPQGEWFLRYFGLANVILGGSVVMIVMGFATDLEVLVIKGIEGAAISVAMGFAAGFGSRLALMTGRNLGPTVDERRAVAEMARARFWSRVGTRIDGGARAPFLDDDPVATCETFLGRTDPPGAS